jgi:uncharacterized protein (TIGR03435 family)
MKAGTWLMAVLAVSLCSEIRMLAQEATQSPAKPAMMAKDADPDWEVVTVKAADPNASTAGFNVHGHEIAIERKTVEAMLIYGYGVHKKQLRGLPDWAQTELWDAQGIASVPGHPDHGQMQSLVRKVLSERFGVALHKEARVMDAYALTVAKGGPKMEKSTSDPNGPSKESDNWNDGQVTMRVQDFSMSELSAILTGLFLDRPAVDRTEVKGRYDFQLRWTWDISRETGADAPPGLTTALQEQLGLRLEPVKAPVETLIVEKIERPAAN